MVIIDAKDAKEFLNEAGPHRVMRVPPTEKRGRVHTSTVTVGVLFQEVKETIYDKRQDGDFTYRLFSGTGAGGQHRNKHQNSVVMTHTPTGLKRSCVSRSKERNLIDAKAALIDDLDAAKAAFLQRGENANRSEQIGNGARGDKKRTYRFQDDLVVDHMTGRQVSCKQFLKGKISLLWK